MGRKQVSRTYQVNKTNTDLSLNIITEATDVEQFDHFAYDVSWAGAGVSGAFKVEFSNEENLKDATWKELDFATSIGITSDAGEHTLLIQKIHFKRARLIYTASGGTGEMIVNIKSSTVGA